MADQAQTVLVVDGEEKIADLVSACLAQSGYRALKASTGSEALQLARDGEAPALLIASLDTTDMSGIQLCAKFAVLYPRTRILFLAEGAKYPGSEVWPFPFIPKPFEVGALRQRVAQVLGPR